MQRKQRGIINAEVLKFVTWLIIVKTESKAHVLVFWPFSSEAESTMVENFPSDVRSSSDESMIPVIKHK